MRTDELGGYAPCPFCKQYSHSIGDDAVASAFNHFHTLIAHPVRGHPMGEAFDEQTRDAAQLLIAEIRRLSGLVDEAREALQACAVALNGYVMLTGERFLSKEHPVEPASKDLVQAALAANNQARATLAKLEPKGEDPNR